MVNHLSLVTTPIELYKGDQIICRGTGFYYYSKWNGQDGIFLTTNYHVVTGKDDPSDRMTDPKGDSLVFYYHADKDDPSLVVGIKIPLITGSNKIWLDHTNPMVDLALIPISFSLPMPAAWNVVNKGMAEADIVNFPTDDVTLVGYPRMFFDKKNALPIFKSGNIASEPSYDFDGNPYFLIDISAFSGNSGSPVFSISKGMHKNSKGDSVLSAGTSIKFLGVYSAGITYDELKLITDMRVEQKGVVISQDMQLGVVWKAHLIEEVLLNNSFDKFQETAKQIVKEKGFKYKMSRGFSDFA